MGDFSYLLDDLASVTGDKSYLKQKRTRITPDPDEDLAIRTVIGEAKGEGERGWQAVAGVIRNRANQARQSLKDVVLAPNQFEPWSSRKQELESYDPNSPTYQNVARAVLPVLRGEAEDPTGGATHFYGPAVRQR
jgi:spore germination cell wall hydrolase CwlJ-like protein